MNITIEIPKLAEQKKRFRLGPKLQDKNTKTAMQNAVRLSHAGWRDIAAVETTRYRSTLKPGIKSIAGSKILQGSVKTFATSAQGFPFPRALESSTRYHYRATRRRGQRTAGQLVKMFKRLKNPIDKLFKHANDLTVIGMKVR